MAGSYLHCIKTFKDGTYRFLGVDLLDGLGDAYEALEEMFDMIEHLSGGDRAKILEAHEAHCIKRACDPDTALGRKFSFQTFSVGCFQWLPRDGVRPGLKKGKVQKRFAGQTSNAQQVYAQAQAWCDQKNKEQRT